MGCSFRCPVYSIGIGALIEEASDFDMSLIRCQVQRSNHAGDRERMSFDVVRTPGSNDFTMVLYSTVLTHED